MQCWSRCIFYSIFFFFFCLGSLEINFPYSSQSSQHLPLNTYLIYFLFNSVTLVSQSSCWKNGPKCDTFQRPIPCPVHPSEWEKLQLKWCLLIYKGMFLRQNINKVNQKRCWQSQMMLSNFIENAPLAPSSASWQC